MHSDQSLQDMLKRCSIDSRISKAEKLPAHAISQLIQDIAAGNSIGKLSELAKQVSADKRSAYQRWRKEDVHVSELCQLRLGSSCLAAALTLPWPDGAKEMLQVIFDTICKVCCQKPLCCVGNAQCTCC